LKRFTLNSEYIYQFIKLKIPKTTKEDIKIKLKLIKLKLKTSENKIKSKRLKLKSNEKLTKIIKINKII
jgi:hypothetical protein